MKTSEQRCRSIFNININTSRNTNAYDYMNTIEGPKDMLPQLPENYHFATEEELDNLPKGALVTEKNKQASRWVNSTISVNSSVNDTDRDAYYYAIPNLPKQTTDAMQTKEQKLKEFLDPHPLPDGYKLATEEELNSVPQGKMKVLCENNWENSIYMIGDCVLKADRAANIYITPIVPPVVADTPTQQAIYDFAKDLEVGDIVCLKSGGPEMTVYNPNANSGVHVRWFYDGEMKGEVFPKETLTFIRK